MCQDLLNVIHTICEVLTLVFAGALVVVTAILARYTYGLVVATQDLFKETKESAARQLGVNTWMHFAKQWDSPEMRHARKENATQIKLYQVKSGTDPILDFFEQVGTVYRLNCINKDLVYSSFSYDAANWWIVLGAYVNDLRTRMKDPSVYVEFEGLVNEFRLAHPEDPEPNLRDAEAEYLKDEQEL